MIRRGKEAEKASITVDQITQTRKMAISTTMPTTTMVP